MSSTPHRKPDDEVTTHIQAVSGTEIHFDDSSNNGALANRLHQLKHRKSGDSRVLLVPQPSLSDPNDPLRWPTWKKFLTFFNGCWFTFMGSITGPVMAAGMIQLTKTFGKTLQELTYANGATLINQGVWNCVWMPFAIKYGRRPVYLVSTLFMGVACIWLAVASHRNYTMFIVGRAFLGAFEAPIESIVPSTVTDMYFLHNRGKFVAMYGLAVLGGNELGPMFSGLIVQSLGMVWAFCIVAMFIGANLVSMLFFMPETKFTGPRPVILPQSESASDDYAKQKDRPSVGEQYRSVLKKTWVSELKFWCRGDSDVNLLNAFIRPFTLLTYPTIVWSCLVYGLALSWNVILGSTVAQMFAPPPYKFNSNAQRLFFLSPFVGSLFGIWFSGRGGDWVANLSTKRNRGIREPEMRLPTCLVEAFFTFFGALWFGLSHEHQMHWAMPVVGAGILSVGSQMETTLGMNYALDCHQESAIAWIWIWVINEFITACGVLDVFMTVAAINVAIYLICIRFYFKGKQIRAWLHRKNFFRVTGLPYKDG